MVMMKNDTEHLTLFTKEPCLVFPAFVDLSVSRPFKIEERFILAKYLPSSQRPFPSSIARRSRKMKTTTENAEHRGHKNKKDVLKLVYPGGKVEIFTAPVPAAQVMKLNPRHCVARPDVFKFPWIVVHPNSILKPGNVFYIVPNHTIRKLLQKQGYDLNKNNHPPDLHQLDKSSRPQVKATYESDSSVKRHGSGRHSPRSRGQSKHDHGRETSTSGRDRCKDESSVEYVHSSSVLEKTPKEVSCKEDQRNEGKHLIKSTGNLIESRPRFTTAKTDVADVRQSSSSGAESEAKRIAQNIPKIESCLKKHRMQQRGPPRSVSFTLPSGEIIRPVAHPRGRVHPC